MTIEEIDSQIAAMSREERIFACALGVMENLKRAGCIDGGKYQVTEDGMAVYERLSSRGMLPTEDEVKMAIALIVQDAGGIE